MLDGVLIQLQLLFDLHVTLYLLGSLLRPGGIVELVTFASFLLNCFFFSDNDQLKDAFWLLSSPKCSILAPNLVVVV